jgi:FMN-dependent NADH-azoreductase
MKLLHLDASSLGQHSVSRALTAAVVAQITRENANTSVTYRDLATHALPHWTPVVDAESEAAKLGEAVLNEFLAADVIVIGAPMYNFSIPSQLKAWIDRVVVAGKTFRYSANGAEGLLNNKKVYIASSRGNVYTPGSPAAALEHHESYLLGVLAFIGLTDVTIVRAEGLAFGPEAKEAAMLKARANIAAMAA